MEFISVPIADCRFQIGNWQSEIGNVLTFRKLESLSCALLSVLLAFLNTRITRHQARMFERGTKVGIEREQRSRDAVPDRARLSRWATTGDVDDEVKFV